MTLFSGKGIVSHRFSGRIPRIPVARTLGRPVGILGLIDTGIKPRL